MQRLIEYRPASLTKLLLFAVVSSWIIVATAVIYLAVRPQVLSFTTSIQAVAASHEQLISSSEPARIKIERLGIDLEVVHSNILVDGSWEVAQQDANYLKLSALPGTGGNTVLYGHNTTAVFAKLPLIELADEIILTATDGAQFSYTVTETQVVSPTAVELIAPTDHEMLTVYTCYGWFDSQRFIVRAEPVKQTK